jgi:chromosome segregation ATPase
MIPLPWVGFAIAFISVVLYLTGHHKGWTERNQEMQVEIAKKNEQARAKETELRDNLNNKQVELKEANDAISKKQTDLNRLIAAGRVRLPVASCLQASSSPAATTGNRDETASESERATLAAIAEIAAAGDRAINQLNACIDAYEQVRKAVNGNS